MTNIACIDLEGVLAPEMWPFIGASAGIPGLKMTTREEPDYYSLMVHRIALLRRHGLKLRDVQDIVATLPVFDGAADFLDALRPHYGVLIVSDAFMEFAAHFGSQLGLPELQCHRLSVDPDGYIDSCLFLPRRGKEDTVQRLQAGGARVLAIGDAFNDLAMLRAADRGFLFRPSRQTLAAAADLRVVRDYGDILKLLRRDGTPRPIGVAIAK